MKKKLTLGVFAAILSTGLLFGCSAEEDQEPTEEPNEQQDQDGTETDEGNDAED